LELLKIPFGSTREYKNFEEEKAFLVKQNIKQTYREKEVEATKGNLKKDVSSKEIIRKAYLFFSCF
jgi:hypothetical protein